jgi:hypothetical protein
MLETVALINGFVVNLVRAEVAARDAAGAGGADPEQAAASAARLAELLATGRYPRFAAAITAGGEPGIDLAAHFERLLDRMLDGLIRAAPAP